MERVIEFAHLRPPMEAPEGVEVCKRVNNQGAEVYILINHETGRKTVPLPWMAYDRLSSRPVTNETQTPSLWGWRS